MLYSFPLQLLSPLPLLLLFPLPLQPFLPLPLLLVSPGFIVLRSDALVPISPGARHIVQGYIIHLQIVSFVRALFPVVGSCLSLSVIVPLQEARFTCGAVRVGPGVPAKECNKDRPADEERRKTFAVFVA